MDISAGSLPIGTYHLIGTGHASSRNSKTPDTGIQECINAIKSKHKKDADGLINMRVQVEYLSNWERYTVTMYGDLVEYVDS